MDRRLYRCAIAAAAADLIAIFSGAFIASGKATVNAVQSPPGTNTHQAIAIAALVLGLGLCLWISRLDGGRFVRTAAWAAFAAMAASSATGWISPRSAPLAVWHACFAHLSIALLAATAVLIAAHWSAAKRVSPGSWVFLRPAAFATPPAVLLQITLGALYRHQITGVMFHMLGAMLVALLTLVVSVVLLQYFSEQPELKRAGTALISLVVAQVCLGIAVFMMLLLDAGTTPAFAWTATGHVSVGALTFAASVAMAIAVHRNIAPRDSAR